MHRVGGEQVSVRLTGGGPYGLRICTIGNGLQHQLVVAKLHKKSKARAAGVRVGDIVLSINGDRCQRMSHETANQLIDYSYDLIIQLLRGPDDQIHPSVASSFRHSPQPPVSPPPSPSPSPSHHSASESTITLRSSTATELFRHQVGHHDNVNEVPEARTPFEASLSVARTPFAVQGSGQQQVFGVSRQPPPPTIKVTGHGNIQESLHPQPQTTKRVRWSGCGLEPGMTTTDEEEEEESGVDGPRERTNGPRRTWTTPSTVSTEVESDGDIYKHSSLLLQQLTTATSKAQPQLPPSFHPTQEAPLNKSKPLLWRPPAAGAISQLTATDSNESYYGVEPTKLPRANVTEPLDNVVHEVVIWSSKTTETEQKPFPWQQSQQQSNSKAYAPLSEVVTPSLSGRPKPNRWQPADQQQQQQQPSLGQLEGQEDLGHASKLSAWQPQRPTAAATIATDKSPSWQAETQDVKPSAADPCNSGERGLQPNRWQPPSAVGSAADHQSDYQPDQLDGDGRRSLHDGSSSPVVTSLFLTRIVTDGSVIAAGTGSDGETNHDSSLTERRKLYGDSSFYEDPEHKYPTIIEQIKMARKVALLLTSPENSTARGQRMFLKRKEQSSKWVIDPLNARVPRLFVSPPQPSTRPLYSPPDSDHSKVLGPEEVERMRYHEEKSRHDVIPFDVCSMLAAELREEKGRGGRLFAKHRDKADQSITPDSNNELIRVSSPRSLQRSRFVPEVVPAPVIRPERNEVDGGGAQPSVSVPVNRLKSMVDLPKPRITPWDSAVEYGTVEPAFEHLRGYRAYPAEQTPTAVPGPPSSVLDHGGRSQGMFREGQGQVRGRDLNQSYDFKRKEVVEDRRTTNYQPNYAEPKSLFTGVSGFEGSSGFIRQSKAKSKGHRPVHFDLGSRSFN